MQFEIKTLVSTPLATNNYLIVGESFVAMVEATATVEQIKRVIGERKLDAVFLTHSHFDHASNLENILKTFDAKCYMHKKCYEKLFIMKNNSMETGHFRLKGAMTKSVLFVMVTRLRLAVKNFCVYRRQDTQTIQ